METDKGEDMEEANARVEYISIDEDKLESIKEMLLSKDMAIFDMGLSILETRDYKQEPLYDQIYRLLQGDEVFNNTVFRDTQWAKVNTTPIKAWAGRVFAGHFNDRRNALLWRM